MGTKLELSDIDPEWEKIKASGNALYSAGNYAEANKLYTNAITLLENSNNNKSTGAVEKALSVEIRKNLAKLYSNRAVSLYQLATKPADEASDKRTPLLEEALADGQKAVEMDGSFDKGHFRCAICLCGLKRPSEAIPYAKSILTLYTKQGRDYEEDKHLMKLLEECNYFRQPLENSEVWKLIEHKDNVKIVGLKDKSAHYREIDPCIISQQSKISVIVKPGRYRMRQPVVIRSGQDVQIVGDIRKPKDVVTIECTGGVFDRCICHLFHLMGGKLKLHNVFLRQASDHPELHAIYADAGSDVVIENSKCSSKVSGCIAANGASHMVIRNTTFERACGAVIAVGRSYISVENCTINNSAKIGVETRDGGFATVLDTSITGSGAQAITSHAGSAGFSAERCKFVNNSCSLKGQEAAINCAAGVALVSDCKFVDNSGGAVMVQEGGYCSIVNTTITGGRSGLGASMKGEAQMKNCKISNVAMGVACVFNQNGKITLENNDISAKTEILLSPDDKPPEMIGRKHKVETRESGNTSSMRMALMLEKMTKLGDHYGSAMPWMDPREFDIQKERVCSPCGMTQRTLGTRFMKCQGCKVTWYCSKECQQKDWKLHKDMCQRISVILKDKEQD